jgi:hypothetical protein
VKSWSFWADPVWRGLRIVSFCTASVTVVILVIYLSGAKSWLGALAAFGIANIAVMLAVVNRTVILRSRLPRD